MILLPPARAYHLWVLFTDALLWLLLAVVFRSLLQTRPGLVTWLALAAATPFFLELYMGQFTFVASALAVLGVWLISRAGASTHPLARYAAAGVLAASSIILKSPALTLVAWVRRRRTCGCWRQP